MNSQKPVQRINSSQLSVAWACGQPVQRIKQFLVCCLHCSISEWQGPQKKRDGKSLCRHDRGGGATPPNGVRSILMAVSNIGAGCGNRTRNGSLEGCGFAIKLIPQSGWMAFFHQKRMVACCCGVVQQLFLQQLLCHDSGRSARKHKSSAISLCLHMKLIARVFCVWTMGMP